MDRCFDKLGQEIVVGSAIVYGHALGRCAGLRIGKVVAPPRKVKARYGNGTTFFLTIMGIDDDWDSKTPRLLSKKSTLQFPNRTIVLLRSQLADPIRGLLDTIEVEDES